MDYSLPLTTPRVIVCLISYDILRQQLTVVGQHQRQLNRYTYLTYLPYHFFIIILINNITPEVFTFLGKVLKNENSILR